MMRQVSFSSVGWGEAWLWDFNIPFAEKQDLLLLTKKKKKDLTVLCFCYHRRRREMRSLKQQNVLGENVEKLGKTNLSV